MSRERPIDRAWPALPLLALVLAALVAVIGVLAAPEEREVDRIGEAVHDFARAAQERRGEDACALLTPSARQVIAARLGTLTCAETVRSFGVGLDTRRLALAEVVGAAVVGEQATVATQQLVLPGNEAFGRGVRLERSGGSWRIAAF